MLAYQTARTMAKHSMKIENKHPGVKGFTPLTGDFSIWQHSDTFI